MKQLLTLLFAFQIVVVSFAQGNWDRISPYPLENTLKTVCVDPQTGNILATGQSGVVIISSDNGQSWETISAPSQTMAFFNATGIEISPSNSIYSYGSRKTILVSSDGGYYWRKLCYDIYSDDGQVLDLDFLDANHAFMVLKDNNNRYLMETHDECLLWDTISLFQDAQLRYVEFVNDHIGFVTCNDNRIFRTQDAGSTWAELSIPDTINLILGADIEVVNESTFYLCGETTSIYKSAALLYTTDSGDSWSVSILPRYGIDRQNAIFFNENEGFCNITTAFGTSTYLTMNGGLTWDISSSGLYAFRDDELYGYSRINDHEVIGVGKGGAVYFSNNKGDTWSLLSERMIVGPITDSWFFENGIGYAHTSVNFSQEIFEEGLYVTGDSAKTWQTHNDELISGTLIDFVSEDEGFMLVGGWDPTFSRTTNGGVSWQDFPFTFGDQYHWLGMEFFDANIGIVYCEDFILRTEDGGESWEETNNGVVMPGYFFNARYVTEDRVFAVGRPHNETDAVWRSDDGGRNWELVPEISGYQFHVVYFYNELMGFIGDFNELYKTNNGGSTWEKITLDSENRHGVNDMHFPTPQVGYIASSNGRVLKSVDSGDTWEVLETGIASGINRIFFFDEDNGVVLGEHGIVFRTSNGGVSFIEETSKNSFHLSDIAVFPNPASEILEITFKKTNSSGVLKIQSLTGAQVYSCEHKEGVEMVSINIATLPVGSYIVTYADENNIVSSQKIIIK